VPKSKTNHTKGMVPGGRVIRCQTAVAADVVPTLTLTDWVPGPLTCTEAGALQVGGGVTDGVMAQLKLTVPVNAPDGVTSRLKFAVCPALIVRDVGEPGVGPREKSGAA
jgi:hypothetical protein